MVNEKVRRVTGPVRPPSCHVSEEGELAMWGSPVQGGKKTHVAEAWKVEEAKSERLALLDEVFDAVCERAWKWRWHLGLGLSRMDAGDVYWNRESFFQEGAGQSWLISLYPFKWRCQLGSKKYSSEVQQRGGGQR